MTQIINKNPIISAQGKSSERIRRNEIRAIIKIVVLAECALIAITFANYVAQKTTATVAMAPHCMAIEPCVWQPETLEQIAKN
jgi:hypothetical protein